ncbi:MAG: hypothetical protein U1E73_10535 [Planctomycetota bacterium]
MDAACPTPEFPREGQRACRVLCYSHDSYGLGHLRRSVTLATALVSASRNVHALCLTGSPVPDLFQLPERCDLVKLPSIGKDADGDYISRRLPIGLGELTSLRSQLITSTVRAFRPDLLLVDHTILGPGEELLPVLQRLRHEHFPTRVVLGMRDVLDSPMRARAELLRQRAFEVVESFYDHVLVYGDRDVFDPITDYGFPDAVAAKTTFTGPVVPPGTGPRRRTRAAAPQLVVTAGGGEDGYELLRGVVAALRGPLRGDALTATVVTGPLLAAEAVADLERAAQGDPRIVLRRSCGDMAQLLDDADLVIGMGGYNTVYETLARGTAMLAAPRRTPREEQWERCTRLADRGLLAVFADGELQDPHRTAAAIRRALHTPPRPQKGLPCRGADVAARSCLQLLGSRRARGPLACTPR